MALRPWMKFYPADWQADQALRSVGLEARCLWLECMCIMHRAEPYGHLVVNGRPVTDAQLAILAGTLPDRVPALMAELATAGVSSRNRAGVIYSRRMTRDEKRSKDGETAKKTGAKVPGSRRHQAIEKTVDKSSTLKVVGEVVCMPPAPQMLDARKEEKPSLAGGSKGSRLSPDFVMPVEWIEDGASAREKASLPPVDLATEAIKFCNHWWSQSGQKGVKSNWRATWVNWALNARGAYGSTRSSAHASETAAFDYITRQ